MKQNEMIKKFLKMGLVGLVTLLFGIICCYGAVGLWGESKVLSVLAWCSVPMVLYFGIVCALRIDNE